jgi:hypothetical protein
MNAGKRILTPKNLLVAVQILIGLTAIAGGIQLISDPSGNSMGLSEQWLARSPFSSFAMPGWALLLIIGVGNALASLMAVFGHRHAYPFSMMQGLFLMIFITVEVWIIGWRVVLQPLYFVLGIVQAFLACRVHKREMALRLVSEHLDAKTPCGSTPGADGSLL